MHLTLQLRSGLLNLIEKTIVEQHVENAVGHRTGKWIAAEGRTMGARRHGASHACRRKAGTDRKAAAQSLGKRHDIRRHIAPFIGKQLACPSHARLHFIKDQQQIPLVGDPTKGRKKIDIDMANATFTLNGLDQDGGRRFVDHPIEGHKITGWYRRKAWQFRLETFQMFRIGASGNRCHGTAMKGAIEGDDFVTLGLAALMLKTPRHLDRTFQCFGSGIAAKNAVGKGMLHQAIGQLLLRLDAVEIGAMPKTLGLCLEHADQMRMGVTEQGHRDAAAKIQIAAAFAIIEIGTFAALERYRSPIVDRKDGWHGCVQHDDVSVRGRRQVRRAASCGQHSSLHTAQDEINRQICWEVSALSTVVFGIQLQPTGIHEILHQTLTLLR